MSQASDKVKWCLKKAEKELSNSSKHRGLVKIKSDIQKARLHIQKSEHYFNATEYLKKGDYSDISASTIFYSMYHCLLAILAKFGYESGNQECTFALIYSLIESKKIDFDIKTIEKISELDISKNDSASTIEVREQYQYGTKLSLEDDIYKGLIDLAIRVLSMTKVIIEA
jgi:uncharacterized protein (UPF0332 family)